MEKEIFDYCFELYEKRHCVSSICIDDIKIGKYIGSGTYGEINAACLGITECDYAVKIVNLMDTPLNQYNREVSMSKIASKFGIGPKYIKDIVCNVSNTNIQSHGFILLEKLDMTLGDVIDEFKKYNTDINIKKIKRELKRLLKHCLEITMYHNDLHSGNIMIKFKPDNDLIIDKLYLIDFGESNIGVIQDVKNDWMKFFNELKVDYPKFFNKLFGDEFDKWFEKILI